MPRRPAPRRCARLPPRPRSAHGTKARAVHGYRRALVPAIPVPARRESDGPRPRRPDGTPVATCERAPPSPRTRGGTAPARLPAFVGHGTPRPRDPLAPRSTGTARERGDRARARRPPLARGRDDRPRQGPGARSAPPTPRGGRGARLLPEDGPTTGPVSTRLPLPTRTPPRLRASLHRLDHRGAGPRPGGPHTRNARRAPASSQPRHRDGATRRLACRDRTGAPPPLTHHPTEIYAKLDFDALRDVALPWPTIGGVR